MRLVTSNDYIYYFHGREVGFTDGLVFWVCHGVVRSGLPDGLVFLVCHGVVRLGFSKGHILIPRP